MRYLKEPLENVYVIKSNFLLNFNLKQENNIGLVVGLKNINSSVNL